ncbi:MAG TPA: hypothetical protein VF195_01680 [Actinomycetota bacterium]
MSDVELVAVALFATLGVRSVVHWLRHPIDDLVGRRDLVLYALFVMARAGVWFGLMGLFLLFASVETQGRAFTDDAAELNWYIVVLLVPISLQFVTGYLLGRSRGGPGPPPDGDRAA